MKTLGIIALSVLTFTSCQKNTTEDRFVFEEERILDLETGDEYYLQNMDTLTVVNIEGEASQIVVSAAPFSDSEELEFLIASYKEKISDRKEDMFTEQKSKIIDERKARYEEYSDEELLAFFNQIHKDDAPYGQQMDVMAELVKREAVLEIDVPKLLEIDTAKVDFNASYTDGE
ncbi:MAG: hypothetical protein JJU34_15615 [Lunatimonas sp.]|uniref:hypothetical protein n=1 Tax=Lunatimonas sp. TaxID=2060141 RepID=UPI00263A5D30|nr:hypothetical protein [Lunatimonas sp.]MCC5938708.1 hypothetical protein [Lunatimonas sp.]